MFSQDSNALSDQVPMASGSLPVKGMRIKGSGIPALPMGSAYPELLVTFEGLVTQLDRGRVAQILIRSGVGIQPDIYHLSAFDSYCIESVG